jgi:transcriptional regulator GlxA family with amidase domain
MRIHIPIFDGFDELDAIGPYEVFRTAAQAGSDCHVSLVTLTDQAVVTAAKGLRVVPGGGWNDSNGGVRRQVAAGDLPDAIRAHWESGSEVASVCTGAMLLERAGVLEDRPAVTHRSAIADLRDTGVEVREHRVVDAGRVVTAGGITSGIDLALHLLEREFGDDIAAAVAAELEHERSDDVAVVR